ncbi:hypothetical protein HPB52_022741 [Rhipicephalus sanguineus]|uniref:Uncharacterized protein n=1 Tax=Rhipicephalus sanguineus TaxID=34632 RepID=A0A9D4QC97_RHISA|nr:hypothetical protein HPB52_022741 [Rhipicephalus sanguineus]
MCQECLPAPISVCHQKGTTYEDCPTYEERPSNRVYGNDGRGKPDDQARQPRSRLSWQQKMHQRGCPDCIARMQLRTRSLVWLGPPRPKGPTGMAPGVAARFQSPVRLSRSRLVYRDAAFREAVAHRLRSRHVTGGVRTLPVADTNIEQLLSSPGVSFPESSDAAAVIDDTDASRIPLPPYRRPKPLARATRLRGPRPLTSPLPPSASPSNPTAEPRECR